MMQAEALLIFIKNPLPGKVKTRLAAGLGAEKALEIYLNLLQITRETVLNLDCRRYLFYSDFIEKKDEWQAAKFRKMLQHEGDLGQRLSAAFEHSLPLHSKAIVIGSDCPDLNEQIIRTAFDRLDYCDIVIGPAEDGGYYLLGMKDFFPELFEGIIWSTDKVLEQTLSKIKAANKTFELCPTLRDLDDASDWEVLKARFGQHLSWA